MVAHITETTSQVDVPSAAGIDGESATGTASHEAKAVASGVTIAHAPSAKPVRAASAPMLPVPARDQMDVAQPLASTMPIPKATPPTSAAAGAVIGNGIAIKPKAPIALTTTS